jgi:tRNA G18 (ribose-2'-O)-methylase SpoU
MPIQNIIEVTDHELTALKWYRTLSREGEHYRDGIFVAEGEKVVPRLLESSNRIVSILLSKEWFQKLEKQIGARPERIDIYLIDKPGMEVLTGRSCYQPLKAVAQIPPNLTIDELISKRKSPSIYVAIEGVSNADNVGALVRNCAALGADGILVSSCASSPYLRRAVHASMGTIFSIPVVDFCSLQASILRLQEEQIFCLAAHPSADGKSLAMLDFPRDVCVVFGSEGAGISESVLAQCDRAAAVPMANGVDSLNVASSSAVFLYEIQRRLGRV